MAQGTLIISLEAATPRTSLGIWTAPSGLMDLVRTGDAVSGRYGTTGRIIGSVTSPTEFTGFCVEDGKGPCTRPKLGQTKWGTLSVAFTSPTLDSFTATWGDCDTANADWTGHRVRF